MNNNNITRPDAKPPTMEDITAYMEKICNKYGIDFVNLKNEPAQRFNFILSQCGIHFFQNTKILKYNDNGIIKVDNNKLLEYLYIYLYITDLYSKIPSLLSFCDFTTINYDTMVNPTRAEMLKMINIQREQRLVNTLEDGKKNPVGTIAILNKCYSWNNETRAMTDDRKTLSVNDLKSILAITQKENS